MDPPDDLSSFATGLTNLTCSLLPPWPLPCGFRFSGFRLISSSVVRLSRCLHPPRGVLSGRRLALHLAMLLGGALKTIQ